MVKDHKHDWRPDGESYRKETCGDECDWSPGVIGMPHKLEKPEHYKRVRRYTCHCGESKTVTLKKSNISE